MPNSQFHTAISAPRYERYFNACGTRVRALALYRANIVLSQQLYGVIGVFEVIFRNSIDRYMINLQGDEWLENAVSTGGYFEVNRGCEDAFHCVQEAIHRLGIMYTHDRLIAKLTFGFWTYLFAAKEYAASGSALLAVFPNRPFGTKQKAIFQNLIKIIDLRNRIAHHEPICFDGRAISIRRTEKRYRLLLELLTWPGCDPQIMLWGIDGVNLAFRSICKIQENLIESMAY